MKNKTGIIVVVSIVVLMAIAAVVYSKNKNKVADPEKDLTNPSSDASIRKKIQDWINGAMTGINQAGNEYGANGASQHENTIRELVTLARGGQHGMPDTIDNAKKYVFRKATAGNTVFRGVFSEYNYPNIEQFSRPNSSAQGSSSQSGAAGEVIKDVIDGVIGVTPLGPVAGIFKALF